MCLKSDYIWSREFNILTMTFWHFQTWTLLTPMSLRPTSSHSSLHFTVKVVVHHDQMHEPDIGSSGFRSSSNLLLTLLVLFMGR